MVHGFDTYLSEVDLGEVEVWEYEEVTLYGVNHVKIFRRPYHIVMVWEMGLKVVQVALVGVKMGMG